MTAAQVTPIRSGATDYEPRKLHFVRMAEIETTPKLEWIIEGILPKAAVTMVFGPSGVGKSFLTVDWALRVATGQEWQGLAVKQGPVVYVAAEGASGLRQRIRAWSVYHDVRPSEDVFALVEQPINLFNDGEVTFLIKSIQAEHTETALVVIDTLGRSMDGAKENDNSDINRILGAADRITRETKATVLLVHHTGYDKSHARGATALVSGVAMSAAVNKQEDGIKVTCDKQKDTEKFAPIELQFEDAPLPDGATSLVLIGRDRDAQPATSDKHAASGRRQRTERKTKRPRVSQREVLEYMRRENRPLGRSEIANLMGIEPHAASNHLKRLVDLAQVVLVDNGKYAVAQGLK